jgi:hypothetical protein
MYLDWPSPIVHHLMSRCINLTLGNEIILANLDGLLVHFILNEKRLLFLLEHSLVHTIVSIIVNELIEFCVILEWHLLGVVQLILVASSYLIIEAE